MTVTTLAIYLRPPYAERQRNDISKVIRSAQEQGGRSATDVKWLAIQP